MSGPRIPLRVAIGVALVALAVPGVASGDAVDDVLNGMNHSAGGLLDDGADDSGGKGPSTSSAGETAAPGNRAGTPPNYVPPAHGTDPHATGTGIILDLAPENQAPLPYAPGGGSEDVVVGSSHGNQNADGSYHGHVTILTLLGNELIPGADTGPGQSSDGPFGDLNAALAGICDATDLCLSLLDVNSQTTDTGTTNSFTAASANLALAGAPVVNATALSSQGSMQEKGGCQTASGSSSVANAELVGIGVANALNSSSSSSACDDGSTSQQSTSSGVALLGTPLPVPAAGCENGTPDSVFNPPLIGLVVSAVCNADDTNGAQLGLPNGVREALSVFVLPVLGTPLAKLTTAAAESRAVAPGDAGPVKGPGGPGRRPGAEGPGGPGGPDGPGEPTGPGPGKGPSAEAPDDLPFTGADLPALALIGLIVMGTGLGMMGLADRRRRLART